MLSSKLTVAGDGRHSLSEKNTQRNFLSFCGCSFPGVPISKCRINKLWAELDSSDPGTTLSPKDWLICGRTINQSQTAWRIARFINDWKPILTSQQQNQPLWRHVTKLFFPKVSSSFSCYAHCHSLH